MGKLAWFLGGILAVLLSTAAAQPEPKKGSSLEKVEKIRKAGKDLTRPAEIDEKESQSSLFVVSGAPGSPAAEWSSLHRWDPRKARKPRVEPPDTRHGGPLRVHRRQ